MKSQWTTRRRITSEWTKLQWTKLQWAKRSLMLAVGALALLGGGATASASTDTVARAVAETADSPSAIKLVVILGLASLAPAIVLTCTCFARFAIAFGFLRSGLGTQSAPPSQVLVGLSLFMTLFVMAPVAQPLHERALGPYLDGSMDEKAAIAAGTPILREFLLRHTRQRDLELFYGVSGQPRPASAADVPLRIAIPAFVVSELDTAFRMGLVLLLPFLVIDLAVAAILAALGMIMLPPVIVSLPVKLLVFVAVDGWSLMVGSLLQGAM